MAIVWQLRVVVEEVEEKREKAWNFRGDDLLVQSQRAKP